MEEDKNVDDHNDYEEHGEHHHARDTTADCQAVASLASLGHHDLVLVFITELMTCQGAVPAQQQHPEDGEGDGKDDQEDGGEQGDHQVLGMTGVNLIRGRVVTSHLHLSPEKCLEI